jgi:hypothetical protein
MTKTHLLVLACLICLFAATACGGQVEVAPAAVASPEAQLQPESVPQLETAPARSISIEDALSDLRELEIPEGVDPALFAELKTAFEQVLTRLYAPDGTPRGKALSALPVEQMCQAWVTDARFKAGGDVELRWLGRHTGDYDLNSEVNVSDLTPLGLFFAKTADYDAEGMPMSSGDNERRCQVDGDDNAEINISDLTTIGLNFTSKHLGYRVYPGYSTDGVDVTWETDYLEGPDGPGEVSVPFNSSTAAGELLHFSLTFTPPAIPSGSTLFVRIVPFDGTEEGMEQTMAVYDGPHSSQFCSMCHTKVERTFLGEADACRLCHASAPEGADWTSAPLMHQSCTNCHEHHGFAIAEMGPVCSTCHGSIASQLEASGMGQCTDCHATPHVPNAHPNTTDCAGCHSAEAAGIADEAMPNCSTCHSQHTFVQTYEPATCTGCHANPDGNASAEWTSAPGQHGACSSCHELHNFSMDQPNTICADCHEAIISGGHAGGDADCLGCHISPHVPEISIAGMECIDCHTSPPEDPEREWAEAPGLHSDCGQCHSLEEHGDKPVPPESICGDCHLEQTAPGHGDGSGECMKCHTYSHLPVKPEDVHDIHLDSGVNCSDCHSMHGGTDPDRETCLACHEDKVDHYPGPVCQTCH